MVHTYTHYLLSQTTDEIPDSKRLAALVQTLLQKPFVSRPFRFEILRHGLPVFSRLVHETPDAPHLQPSPGQTLQLTFYDLQVPAWTDTFGQAGLGTPHGLTFQVGHTPISLTEKHWTTRGPVPSHLAAWMLCHATGKETPPCLNEADGTLSMWSSILGTRLDEFGAFA